ncbi:MAG: hypothetical protein KJ900_12810 [Proteobacteria bacterium]|nr:hypothetical protein [Desulfocapsa sp.]MBU3984293.1 hypothetical protein [Pseudomonadota bacterium]MCG2745382.1 hypothetical protein [Desulfobacteraceae bacterium]MBU4043758.1 hypothetical protein [Pseudomonadota bacterium]MBU4167726.1 hypothetical protein [Pseudomonadota bacterium]
MKIMKSFFKVIKMFFIINKHECGTGSLNKAKVVKTKVIVFAAIFIPCLLQFPLVVFGQDRTDGVNSGLVELQSNSKGVDGERIIADGSNFGGKSRFVSNNSSSKLSSFTPPVGKTVDGNIPKKDNHKANKSEDSFSFQDDDYWLLRFYLFLFAGFLVAHSGNKEGQQCNTWKSFHHITYYRWTEFPLISILIYET